MLQLTKEQKEQILAHRHIKICALARLVLERKELQARLKACFISSLLSILLPELLHTFIFAFPHFSLLILHFRCSCKVDGVKAMVRNAMPCMHRHATRQQPIQSRMCRAWGWALSSRIWWR